MSKYEASMDRDANRVVISSNEAFKTVNTVTFADAAGQGAVGTVTLFTVTGTVLVSVFGVCSDSLTGDTATIEVGIADNTNTLLAQTTATDIDAGEVWVDNAPATAEAIPAPKVLTGGTDIIATVGTAAVTGGTISFYALWRPLSEDANLV